MSFKIEELVRKYPSLPYVTPFVLFLVFLGLKGSLHLDATLEYVSRVLVVSASIMVLSRRLISSRPSLPLQSFLLGILVFAVWILPDLLWPSYRNHWIFQNALTGKVQSSNPSSVLSDPVFLGFRFFGTAVVVPIIEEVFWRGWLMRYIISNEFEKVRLGPYAALSFWLTAALFATEHGPFWDVGLLAGIIYNYWIIRTRNLSDCILAHAVTNACLGIYVVASGQWQYWL